MGARRSALTYDYDGYSKFELGGRFTLGRKITDQYEVGLVYAARHDEVTNATIEPDLLGRTSYFVSAIGFTQTLDLRKNPLVAPRGFVFDNTVDLATSAIGSDIDFLRATGRLSYYLSFARELPALVGEDLEKSVFERWFERSLLAFGARGGIIYPFDTAGTGEALAIPIDERFFSGGSTTVRRLVNAASRRQPPGGGGFLRFQRNTPSRSTAIYWARSCRPGNLLPDAKLAWPSDMRCGGLRVALQSAIGPVRLDCGRHPSPNADEAFGGFHFSFGFAF